MKRKRKPLLWIFEMVGEGIFEMAGSFLWELLTGGFCLCFASFKVGGFAWSLLFGVIVLFFVV